MIKGSVVGVVLIFLCLQLGIIHSKDAVPMAKDPVLEETVNQISDELRCLVCQNQTISDSSAPLAVDLKNQVRTMVGDGKTEAEIIDYMVERYGDFIRYRPDFKATTVLLWVGPFVALGFGLILLIRTLFKRRAEVNDKPLSAEEHARVDALLSDEGTKTEGEQSS